MYLIRDIMYCKPGQARPMVEKFKAMSKHLKSAGFQPFRILTDVSAERYWTVVAEMEVDDFETFVKESRSAMSDKETQEIMKGYHDLVEGGRREIYMVEG
jgi:heme-degrading monooxygenase HmoA